jgi:hypothetical protein
LPPPGTQAASGSTEPEAEGAKKKKGFFGKIADVFKGESSSHDKNTPPSSKPQDGGAKPQ